MLSRHRPRPHQYPRRLSRRNLSVNQSVNQSVKHPSQSLAPLHLSQRRLLRPSSALPVQLPLPPLQASQAISAADQATARDLRERYANDASRAAIAQRNAEEIRRNLSAKGMSLNAQTAAAVDRLGLLLDEASEAMRDHRWDDALSNLQAVEATIEKINKTVGN